MSSIPRANSEKKMLEISGIIVPTVVDFLLDSPRATALGRQPTRTTVRRTSLRVVGLTFGFPLTTRETVAIDTLASRATSYIVTFISMTSIELFFVVFIYYTLTLHKLPKDWTHFFRRC